MNARKARVGGIAVLLAMILGIRFKVASETAELNRDLRATAPTDASAVVPTGYFVNGMLASGAGWCNVVRLAEAGCTYCDQGRTEWNRLMGQLSKDGCRSLGIVPRRKGALNPTSFGYGGDSQLAFITMDWVKGFHPLLTPSTMVIGPGGRVLWYRSGQLHNGDAAAAASAVAKAVR